MSNLPFEFRMHIKARYSGRFIHNGEDCCVRLDVERDNGIVNDSIWLALVVNNKILNDVPWPDLKDLDNNTGCLDYFKQKLTLPKWRAEEPVVLDGRLPRAKLAYKCKLWIPDSRPVVGESCEYVRLSADPWELDDVEPMVLRCVYSLPR